MVKNNVVSEESTVPVERKGNLYALLSFIFSVAFIVPFNTVVSIVLGHIALNDFKRNPEQDWRGFAIAGLIISYTVVGAGLLLLFIVLGIAAAS